MVSVYGVEKGLLNYGILHATLSLRLRLLSSVLTAVATYRSFSVLPRVATAYVECRLWLRWSLLSS